MANEQPTFPVLPPSLSAGDHGMRDYYAAQDVQRPSANTVPEITPYLGLRARLSQIWINRWTVMIFLILVRVLIAIAGLHNDLGSAKNEALSACNAVETAGSVMASMPHYMSKGVNEMAATGVEKAVNGLMSMLLLTITGVEELVAFWINMMTQTYLCLITLVVSGALHAAIALIEDVNGFLNSSLNGIVQGIGHGVEDAQNDLNKFLSGLNSIPAAFGAHTKKPSVDFNDTITAIENVHINANFTDALSKLNASIPTFSQVNNLTQTAIRFPFEEVKGLVNGSLTKFSFNRSLLPVPQKEQLTFCSDNNDISNFFQHLADIANDARKAFLAVLIILGILACIPMAWKEIRRWRTMQQRAQLVGDKSYDPLDVIYIASRPYTASAGIKAAKVFRGRKRQLLARWTIAYMTSPPALVVLALGITGLLACLCQFLLLKAVEKEVPALAGDIGNFTGKIVNTINNASENWAVGTNKAISGVNNDINTNILGWVNTTTGALNNTLNTFVRETTTVLNDTFGGTVLQDPVNDLFNCLIGLKVAGIEKGLTWVSDNAHVNFPELNANTFSLDHIASEASDGKTNAFMADPSGDATAKVTAAIAVVAAHIEDAIKQEALISLGLILFWVLVFLIGLIRAIWLSARHDKVRGEGGPSYAGDIPLENQQRAAIPDDAAPAYEPPKTTREVPHFSNPFASNRRAQQPGTQRSVGASEGSNDEDPFGDEQKVGFAGDRGPVGDALRAPDRVQGRRSEYAVWGAVDEKSGFE